MDRGIVLAGGGALLQGLDERLRHETQMPVHLAESPLTCVAVGSGRSLEEFGPSTARTGLAPAATATAAEPPTAGGSRPAKPASAGRSRRCAHAALRVWAQAPYPLRPHTRRDAPEPSGPPCTTATASQSAANAGCVSRASPGDARTATTAARPVAQQAPEPDGRCSDPAKTRLHGHSAPRRPVHCRLSAS